MRTACNLKESEKNCRDIEIFPVGPFKLDRSLYSNRYFVNSHNIVTNISQSMKYHKVYYVLIVSIEPKKSKQKNMQVREELGCFNFYKLIS